LQLMDVVNNDINATGVARPTTNNADATLG